MSEDALDVAGTVDGQVPRYAKVLDQTRCIGCHACTTACKSENEVPLSVTRTYVKSVDVGEFPQARRAFQVTRCNQCVDAPCVNACPTSAMFQREDGIVDFDKSICIGCKACMAACPYDAIFINPEDHAAEKCNFCAHRIDMGLEPACVVVCPAEAIIVGDLRDPSTKVAEIVNRDPVTVRRPEKDTQPKVFYKGAHQATLDPLGAMQPPADIFAWASKPELPGKIHSGSPTGTPSGNGAAGNGQRGGNAKGHNSSAAALLSYDVPHAMPWDWRVSLYTWTKSIAAGVYALAAVMFLLGFLSGDGGTWRWGAPLVSAVFLALTGAILIWDLEHPERFYFIFTRPQWSSWLVKGGVIISLYGVVLAAHMLVTLLGGGSLQTALTVPGIPFALIAGVYTAFLFAQAKARDLWQNPLLPAHFVVQAALAGSAVLLPMAALWETDAVAPLAVVLAVSVAVHLLMLLGEVTLPHGTAHARMAVGEMVAGSYRDFFWGGAVLAAVGLAAPWIGWWAAPFALAGLLAHEHAYVQAGQSVPLA